MESFFIINSKLIQSIIYNYSIHKKFLTSIPEIWKQEETRDIIILNIPFYLNNLFFLLKNNPSFFLKKLIIVNSPFNIFPIHFIYSTQRAQILQSEIYENFFSTSTELLIQKGKKKSKHDFPTLVIILLLSIFADGSNYRLVRRFESWQ